jgi:DNA end-binding protein Ku
VDPVYFEDTYYLAADKGGEKPYRLLADAMAKSARVAIAALLSRGKEQLAELSLPIGVIANFSKVEARKAA